MKYCTKCGNPLADDANFCTACGHKVGTPIINDETGEQQTQGSFIYQMPAYKNPEQSVVLNRNEKVNTWIAFLILLASTLAPIVGILVLVSIAKSKPNTFKFIAPWAIALMIMNLILSIANGISLFI